MTTLAASPKRFFFAYPASPPQIGSPIEVAAAQLRTQGDSTVETWRQVDIPGRFLADGLLAKIDAATILVADITSLNFNVTFEVGYAIGKGRRAFLVVNGSLSPEIKEMTQLGIYDTLGYATYQNSGELAALVAAAQDAAPLHLPIDTIDKGAPIFVLDTLYKTDASIRIISKIKKSRIRFRSFDPNEQPRLSTVEAYGNASRSLAIVVNLLSSRATDHRFNNLRGAFLAGLGHGLDREVLVLQEGDEPVPLDYRDFVAVYKHPNDVDKHINELIPRVAEGLQQAAAQQPEGESRDLLSRLNLGDPAAENEATNLGEYYVDTDEYHKVLSGGVRLAVGRKGSGKTALFLQVRDALRVERKNIVIDLKPEGHQLKRFRHLVIEHLSEPVQEHVVTAFWEYVLLLEICHKILEKDHQLHVRDHTLFEPYQRLRSLYDRDELTGGEADFSERMLRLVRRLSDDFGDKWHGQEKHYLRTDEVTELVFKHDIPELRDNVLEYLTRKNAVVILFDNIDKSWPTRGIEAADIVILRGLLEASRKLEKLFRDRALPFVFTVFLRNDVYEFLVSATPDRGKESKVSLDWTDPELLREVLRRRLVYNGVPADLGVEAAWQKIAVSHREGEDSAEYLIERSLMRPRNLLRLVNYAKSSAVNLGRARIEADDVTKAAASFSADSVNEISLEIRDVFPNGEDLLYHFMGVPSRLTSKQLREILEKTTLLQREYDTVIELLLWFAFLGLVRRHDGVEKETYIFDVYYDMKKLQYLSGGLGRGDEVFSIHRAFWPFLEIGG